MRLLPLLFPILLLGCTAIQTGNDIISTAGKTSAEFSRAAAVLSNHSGNFTDDERSLIKLAAEDVSRAAKLVHSLSYKDVEASVKLLDEAYSLVSVVVHGHWESFSAAEQAELKSADLAMKELREALMTANPEDLQSLETASTAASVAIVVLKQVIPIILASI